MVRALIGAVIAIGIAAAWVGVVVFLHYFIQWIQHISFWGVIALLTLLIAGFGAVMGVVSGL